MNVDVHITTDPDPRIDDLITRLDELTALVRGLVHQGEETMADLTALTNEVAENTSVTDSAAALLQRLADEIEAAGTDQAALDALVEQLRTNDTTLADAVVANTPAEEPTGPGDGSEPTGPIEGDGGIVDPDVERPA